MTKQLGRSLKTKGEENEFDRGPDRFTDTKQRLFRVDAYASKEFLLSVLSFGWKAGAGEGI